MLRSRLVWLGGAVVLAAAGVVFYVRGRTPETRYQASTADRGDVVEVVGATGTLQAVTTVQVGSQVSGTIQSLNADFNSVVKKGQVIARLDPSLLEARLGQSKANLVSARANAERSRASVTDTKQKYERAKELAAQNLLPQAELETAKANHDGALAQLKASEAAVTQAEANLNQAQVDLDHSVITAPIDGVVINRAVDIGQTVAASFQAPTLFVIANDLTQMKVNASIDEADIGRVRAGMEVTFRVDAHPDRQFHGRVEQVRLQPTTVQNVVTYNTIISAENPQLLLMPGMTATVSVVVRKSEDTLRIPASALRFRPEGFDANKWMAGQRSAPSREDARGLGPEDAAPASPAAGPSAAANGDAKPASPSTDAAGSERRRWAGRGAPGSATGSPGSPEGAQRSEGGAAGAPGGSPAGAGGFRREGASRPGGFGEGGAGFARGGRGDAAGRAGGFGGGMRGEGMRSAGIIFVLGADGKPELKMVRLGISDGQFVEVRAGLEEGARVVTGTESGAARGVGPRPGGSPSTNPFAPGPPFQQRRRQ
jgi:HlyD family secretion protein